MRWLCAAGRPRVLAGTQCCQSVNRADDCSLTLPLVYGNIHLTIAAKTNRPQIHAWWGVLTMRRLLTVAIAATVFAVSLGVAGADTVTFFAQSDDWYLYRGDSTDGTFETGDTITVSGMDLVTNVLTPSGFSVVFGPYAATWTALQDVSGVQFFGVLSTETAGSVPWTVTSDDSGSGTVTGPQFVPEPATIALFSMGLLTLGVGARRRRASAE